jgi:hypothetical protein
MAYELFSLKAAEGFEQEEAEDLALARMMRIIAHARELHARTGGRLSLNDNVNSDFHTAQLEACFSKAENFEKERAKRLDPLIYRLRTEQEHRDARKVLRWPPPPPLGLPLVYGENRYMLKEPVYVTGYTYEEGTVPYDFVMQQGELLNLVGPTYWCTENRCWAMFMQRCDPGDGYDEEGHNDTNGYECVWLLSKQLSVTEELVDQPVDHGYERADEYARAGKEGSS